MTIYGPHPIPVWGFTLVPVLVPATKVRDERGAPAKTTFAHRDEAKMTSTEDFLKPAAVAIPKEGYFELVEGPYGPIFPKTPANYGFSVLAKVKPGREPTIRDYAKTIESAVRDNPSVLAPLKLHYLRWILFPIGGDLYFMYQGIFDTDFDKYMDDALMLFLSTGITTVFVNLEGFPEDWKDNLPAVVKYFREHQVPSFLEYGEYPYVSADEIKKALRLKAAFGTALDQLQ
jgi:hypothetical protein